VSSDVDWKSLVFESGWMQKLDQLAAKRFGAGGLAEEAGNYVIEQLSNDNWASLTSFKGQCKPETYLHTVTNNYLEEFSRKRFGRPRPPRPGGPLRDRFRAQGRGKFIALFKQPKEKHFSRMNMGHC